MPPNWPLVDVTELEPGQRVWVESQHSIAPNAFTIHTDHEVIRVWLWASNAVRALALRPWNLDGPQKFVPAHHITAVRRCPAERRIR